MQSKLLHENDGKRTFALILETGDEAMACLQQFAVRERLAASQITAIGAMSSATLAFFDWESKTYRPIPVNEQVEVASLVGDIALGPDRTPSVHVHAVLGRRDGAAGRSPSEGTRTAHARDHHHGVAGSLVQGERRGKWARPDQRTQLHIGALFQTRP